MFSSHIPSTTIMYVNCLIIRVTSPYHATLVRHLSDMGSNIFVFVFECIKILFFEYLYLYLYLNTFVKYLELSNPLSNTFSNPFQIVLKILHHVSQFAN